MRELWRKLKVLFRYRKERTIHSIHIEPVRDENGKPAKHLEQAERRKHLHVTEGYRDKTVTVTRIP